MCSFFSVNSERSFSCFHPAVPRPALKEYKNSSSNDPVASKWTWAQLVFQICKYICPISLVSFGRDLFAFFSMTLCPSGWVSSFLRVDLAAIALDETARETGCGYTRLADTSVQARITSDCLFRLDYRGRVLRFRSQVTPVVQYVRRHLHVSGRRVIRDATHTTAG